MEELAEVGFRDTEGLFAGAGEAAWLSEAGGLRGAG